MNKIQQQLLDFYRGLTAKQLVLLFGSVLLVGGTVWVFVRLLGEGDYKTLYSGMAPGDAQSLAQRLATQNISYQLSPDGTSVLVRADQLDKARIETASQGPLASGRMGFELFDKPNWSGSDFSEKVNYQRALEAELERTIQTMSGVEAVRVHLVLPRESLFVDRERAAKAGVVLKLRGTRLNEQMSTSVANLVSSSWDDLSPQNVTVITTDGQMPSQGHSHSTPLPGLQDLESTLAERVVDTLAPIIGSDHVKSSVTIDYDANSGESTEEVYDPDNSAILTAQSSQETVGDLEPAGIPGTPSNAPSSQSNSTAVAQAKTTSSTQGIRSESKTYAVSRITHHILEPAGRVKRIAAAIVVDDALETKTEGGKTKETRRKRTPDEMKQLEELARAAVGFDEKRGDQFSMQNISFTRPTLDTPVPPGKFQRLLLFLEQWTFVLRYIGLLALFGLVYALILRPVKKQVLALLRNPHAAFPAAAVAGAVGAALTDDAGLAGLPNPDVASDVREAVSLKKQLVTKVKQDPEGASRLIQNWLNEKEPKQ